MHRALFVLLLGLLMLRGWAGDALATSMATGQTGHVESLIQSLGINDHSAVGSSSTQSKVQQLRLLPGGYAENSHIDCAAISSGHGENGSRQCDSCGACQACHTLALSLLETHRGTLSVSPSPPRSSAVHFVSAAAALGQKPPIS